VVAERARQAAARSPGTRESAPRLLLERRPGVGKTTVAGRLIELLRTDGVR
jgi:hypothetical protein